MGFRSGLPQQNSSIYLIPLWLDTLKRPSRVPGAACRSGTIAPPPKSGGACGPKKRCAVAHPFSALMTGRSRPHLSLREGLEQPPRSGCQGRSKFGPLRRSKSRPVGEAVAVFVGRLERSLRSPFRAAQA